MLARVALAVALSVATFACQQGSKDQETRPLPAAEPPPTTTGASPAAPEEPAPRRAAASRPADSNPVQAVREVQPSTAQPAAETADASAPTQPSSKPEATVAAPSADCIQKCQGAMQGCVSAPTDGGVPGFSNVEVCKKAFATCQASCAQ